MRVDGRKQQHLEKVVGQPVAEEACECMARMALPAGRSIDTLGSKLLVWESEAYAFEKSLGGVSMGDWRSMAEQLDKAIATVKWALEYRGVYPTFFRPSGRTFLNDQEELDTVLQVLDDLKPAEQLPDKFKPGRRPNYNRERLWQTILEWTAGQRGLEGIGEIRTRGKGWDATIDLITLLHRHYSERIGSPPEDIATLIKGIIGRFPKIKRQKSKKSRTIYTL